MNQQETLPCPDDVLAAIPWYPSELDANTRGEVESHAAQCAACRDEIAFVHGEPAVDIDLENRDRVYAKLLERIEEHEGVARPRGAAASTRDASDAACVCPGRWPWLRAWRWPMVSGGLGAASSQWFQATPESTGAAPAYETASDTSAKRCGGRDRQ